VDDLMSIAEKNRHPMQSCLFLSFFSFIRYIGLHSRRYTTVDR
jgi:hypothetical protein